MRINSGALIPSASAMPFISLNICSSIATSIEQIFFSVISITKKNAHGPKSGAKVHRGHRTQRETVNKIGELTYMSSSRHEFRPCCSRGTVFGTAQYGPVDVWAKVFAADLAVGRFFDVRAALSWNLSFVCFYVRNKSYRDTDNCSHFPLRNSDRLSVFCDWMILHDATHRSIAGGMLQYVAHKNQKLLIVAT